MSVIDEVLEANEIYSHTHELRRLTPRPARKLAILTCMDTRLSIRTLGLMTGDAHIIRNAGGIVTEDSLRSLLISHYLLDTEEIMVINHTDCGPRSPLAKPRNGKKLPDGPHGPRFQDPEGLSESR